MPRLRLLSIETITGADEGLSRGLSRVAGVLLAAFGNQP
jgi:hypothetical protein